ncbi:hypothetical protein L6452_02721 [Arctium lappa]|uniref:Uncharacterized protein n=1 Tax=Arctium lappa TaxID=4217 RepID=A0ACB9FL51_ARCLA|nr:hypothetical protein L6452_02721 [Arctium lappa]
MGDMKKKKGGKEMDGAARAAATEADARTAKLAATKKKKKKKKEKNHYNQQPVRNLSFSNNNVAILWNRRGHGCLDDGSGATLANHSYLVEVPKKKEEWAKGKLEFDERSRRASHLILGTHEKKTKCPHLKA